MGEEAIPGRFGPYPGSGVMLSRLAAHRGTHPEALAHAAAVDVPALRAAFDGAEPGADLVARLAPALGLRTADLHAVLWTPVPEALAPLDARAAKVMRELVRDAIRLTAGELADTLAFARSLPQQPRPNPIEPLPADRPVSACLGGVLVRLLRNRNLDQIGMAYTLASLTPTYLSISTYFVIGNGNTALKPGWVADFAAVVGIEPGCLSALTGIPLPDPLPSSAPMTGEYAELLWEMRRLTRGQAEQVRDRVAARARPL